MKIDTTHKSRNILLVEDNELNQKIAVTMLDDMGHQIDVASNGEEALAKFNTNDYDLIFMDIGLPDMDGLDVTSKIRQQEDLTRSKNTPIVAMTAHVYEEDKNNCLEAGMNDVITKPVMLESIIAKIESTS